MVVPSVSTPMTADLQNPASTVYSVVLYWHVQGRSSDMTAQMMASGNWQCFVYGTVTKVWFTSYPELSRWRGFIPRNKISASHYQFIWQQWMDGNALCCHSQHDQCAEFIYSYVCLPTLELCLLWYLPEPHLQVDCRGGWNGLPVQWSEDSSKITTHELRHLASS